MNWLNYHHLYYFWLLNQEGTFTKVAERLNIAQSAVSGQIMQLEESLQLSLLDRTNKRKPLFTEEGKRVLEYANTIFETGEELQNWVKTGSTSKQTILRIGSLSGLSRNFQFEFLRPAMSDTNLKIDMTTGDQDKLVRLLKDHSLDLILSSHNVPSDGKITFYSHVLQASSLIFVTRKSTKLKSKLLKENLLTRRIYLPGKNFEARAELDSFLEKLRIPLSIAGEVDDIALLRLIALKTDAIVAIPRMGVLNEIDSKELQILTANSQISQKFYAITRQKRIPNKLIMDLIKKMQ